METNRMIAHIIFGILLFFEGLSKRDHCHHKVLYVQDVTQHTAVLYWKSSHTKGFVEDYKVVCAGVRQYRTREGDKEVDLDTVTQFVPQGVSRVFLSKMQPNFNYSCVVQAESEQHGSRETRPLLFSTLYSAPEAPKSPAITYGIDGKQIDIKLFPTSTKYGPIDGYEVQFYILDKDTVHEHGQPVLPKELIRPRGLLASVKTAQSSLHSIPFSIAFRNSTLPSQITVSDSLLQGAMRSGTTYSIITVAYTDNYEEISSPLLYTSSIPSKPFSLTVTSSKLHSESQSMLTWLESLMIRFSMAVGVVTSNLILLYFIVVGCCIVYVETHHGNQPTDREHALQTVIQVQDSIKPKGIKVGKEDCKVHVTSLSSQYNVEHLSTQRREKVEQDNLKTAQVQSDEAYNKSSNGVNSTQHCHSSGSCLPLSSTVNTTTPPSSSALAMSSSGSGTSASPPEAIKDQPSMDYSTELTGGRSIEHGMLRGRSSPQSVVQWQPSCSSLPQPHSTTLLPLTVHSSTLPSCSDLATADSDSSTCPLESLVEIKPRVPTGQEGHTVLEDTNNATESLKKTDSQLLLAEESINGRSHESKCPTADTREDVACSGRGVEEATASSAELGTSICDDLREGCMEAHDPEGNNVYQTTDHFKSEKSCSCVDTHVQDTPSEAVDLPCKEHAPFIPHSISETLKKAQHSTKSLQTSVHSGWSTTSKETYELNNAIGAMSFDAPNLSGTELIRREQSLPPSDSSLDLHPVIKEEDHQARVLNATQQVEHCVSSLVFIPRGLSQGPWTPPGPVMEVHRGSSPTSMTASTPDLAPDLEMDLYGISYSLDTSLNDSQH